MKRFVSTREGRRFVLALILVGLAAFNTGNNLIYLIFSLMLSLGLISLGVARLNLAGLQCTLDFHEPLHAGTPFRLDATITNRKPFASYSVSVVLPFARDGGIYFDVVRRGPGTRASGSVKIPARGRYQMHSMLLRTGFPSIFLYMERSIPSCREIIVYPSLVDVTGILDNMDLPLGGRERTSPDPGGEYLSTREYVYGEESRRIDWKATARLQKTMVREYSRVDERIATVILDDGSASSPPDFERSVSVAASLCAELIARGYFVRLITCMKVVPYGMGEVHLFKMLDILAEVRPLGVSGCPLDEKLEGLSMLVHASDRPVFGGLAPLCSGVVDARHI